MFSLLSLRALATWNHFIREHHTETPETLLHQQLPALRESTPVRLGGLEGDDTVTRDFTPMSRVRVVRGR